MVTICSPKGGVGKTTIARNLLVSAQQAGLRAVALDFDPQASLAKWAARRERTREAFPDFAAAEVRKAELHHWRACLSDLDNFDLTIVDTPPSVEEHLGAVRELCRLAAFVVVPTGHTLDDLDSVIPWMGALNDLGTRAAFCINRANRRTNTFERARARLVKAGAVCPVEIPLLEDMHAHAESGLAVVDIARSRGLEPAEAIWAFVRREAGL